MQVASLSDDTVRDRRGMLALAQAVAASSSDVISPMDVAALAERIATGKVTDADVDRASQIWEFQGAHAASTRKLAEAVFLSRPLHFDKGTPPEVQKLLAELCGTQRDVRIFFGDTETGIAWADENDVYGRIGRSMGPKRVPLLIAKRKDGGPALLTACILAIKSGPHTFLYKHPKFDPGVWTWETGANVAGYVETAFHNGDIHARFKKAGAAVRYCAFMEGRRMTP